MNIPDWERKFNKFVTNANQPVSPDLPPEVVKISEFYNAEKGKRSPRDKWRQWEYAGQMAAKAETVIRNPQLDPLGEKRERYISALKAFDTTTGKFPDNVDPQTGRIRE